MKAKLTVVLLAGTALAASGLVQVASARMGGHAGGAVHGPSAAMTAPMGAGTSHMGGTHTRGTPPTGMTGMGGMTGMTGVTGMTGMVGAHTPGTPPADMPQAGGMHTPAPTTP
ncbi:MAG: hypothetical protein HY900_09385 [Deltaproteobacteria bacterium]|nr:hypothetical protein [Deltaproteobacteria bacterium]